MPAVGPIRQGNITKIFEPAGSVPKRAAGILIGIISLMAYGFFLAYHLSFICIAMCAAQSRKIIPLLIIVAALIYTAVSGYTGIAEVRRNAVLFPVLFFLLFYCVRRPLTKGHLSRVVGS